MISGTIIDGNRRTALVVETGLFCLILVAAGAFVVAVRARTGWDQDIWWHLRTGQWIVEHGGLPVTDPFSQYGQGKEWVAYSWLFALVANAAYQALGLKGLVLLSAGVSVLIAASFYVLVRGLGATPLTALALTVFGFYAVMPLTTPRPWLFSMLFMLIVVHIIVTTSSGVAGRGSRLRWLLPPLFALWANIHIQFVVGLLVLGAAMADALWYERIDRTPGVRERAGPSLTSWIVLGALCVAATLVNPYHVRIWLVARELMTQTALWTRIGELLAPDFRQDPDWVMLAMTLTAAGCIGWQARHQPIRVFLLLLFVVGVYLGFKSRRDTWLTVMGAACVIARARPASAREPRGPGEFPGWVGAVVAVPMAVLICVASAPLVSEPALRTNVARSFPDAAAAFVEQHVQAGPIYNHFDWGGYLIWRLPQFPVHMDGRALVHGEARILKHVDTWQGKPAWRTDPELVAAKIVIGPRDAPLTSLLRLDDRFTLLYEDPHGPAVVFAAR